MFNNGPVCDRIIRTLNKKQRWMSPEEYKISNPNSKFSVNMADSKTINISSEHPEEYQLDENVSSSYKTHRKRNLKTQSEHLKSLSGTVAPSKRKNRRNRGNADCKKESILNVRQDKTSESPEYDHK